MRYLFLIFILTPIIEIWLIVRVSEQIQVVPTITLIVLTAMLGAALLKKQGVSTMFRANQRMQQGQMPINEMVEGLLLAVAGALLLTPGFITDVAGFLLLMPLSRQWLVKRIVGKIQLAGNAGQGSSNFHFYGSAPAGKTYESEANPGDKTNFIEGELLENHPSKKPDKKNSQKK